MAKIKYNVCVLTVTYGNRWQFLERVLKRVLEFGQVTNIVVVDNASSYDVTSYIKRLDTQKIIVLNNPENLGSAGGYKQAIEYAINNTDADFLWLLDDDNLPERNALEILLYEWDKIEGKEDKKALFCLRPDRMAHVKIASGENPCRYYLVPDNFMGFSFLNIIKNQYLKVRDKLRKARPGHLQRVIMPYVPYGGLFMHRSMITAIGLPNELFFLYVDDSEYSYRITQQDGKIWLIPSCKLMDIDKSQGLDYKTKVFHSKLLDQWNFRTYYAVRNRIYFYSAVAVRNKVIFKINKALYLSYLYIVSLLSSKKAEYKRLLSAVNDGLTGNLGKADPGKY
ncbi:MAG: glycosyltransferase [Bacteroidetes bacterium]|nr:glycosyltransferase [Bacteroidota bacterium]